MKITVKSGLQDVLDFARLIPERKKRFENGSDTPLPSTYRVNETAASLHPKEQNMTVTAVDELAADVKCFTLSTSDGAPAAYFRAGQYLSLRLRIGEAVVTRPYSIASSPKLALEGKYKIAVKRVDDGFVSGYLLDNLKVGDALCVSEPMGNFCYEPLRDAPTVVGLAGGSGITPFLSLAQAIADGTEQVSLVLIYGSKTKKDLLFFKELDALQKDCEQIRLVPVLSESKAKGFEQGFITKELIEKYAPENSSFFVCGSEAMYSFIEKELAKMNLRRKHIRFEMFGVSRAPETLPGYPCDMAGKTFTCSVIHRGEKLAELDCAAGESLLVALERAGVTVPSACRSGECGVCRCKLEDGEVFVPDKTEHRREGDIRFGYIHPCCTFPVSDVVLVI